VEAQGPTRQADPPDAGAAGEGREPAFAGSLWRGVGSAALVALGAAAFLYFVLPQLAGLDETWRRLEHGDPWWLGLAILLELLSFAGYIVLLRAVVRTEPPLSWRRSYQITMAGLAATRLFATGGAGGIALTAWALRRSGIAAREVVAQMTTFLVAVYAVFMASLVICGIGLRAGILPGEAPLGLTVIPAAFAAGVIVAALALAAFVNGGRRSPRADRPRGAGRLVEAVAAFPPAIADGTRGALDLLRRREPGLVGAVAWWGFDIAVLGACFAAYGDTPDVAVLVMGYFTGMLANTLPLPGGVGAVEGGMIGAFIAFGVPGGLAIVAVLTYRLYAFWLPTVPGAIAFVQLRRSLRAEEATGEARTPDRREEEP
jgi:uncharacterized membrane protein YbhN (UPF0104 family)